MNCPRCSGPLIKLGMSYVKSDPRQVYLCKPCNRRLTLKERVCPYCGSTDTVRCGFRYTKQDPVPNFRCNSCLKRWGSSTLRFYKYKTPALLVLYAVLRYFSHPSTREIQKELHEKFGLKISNVSLSRWIRDEERVRKNLENRRKIMPSSHRQLVRVEEVLRTTGVGS